MKKTLIALAVLAASGASFAQVTITGNLAMGYQSTTTGAVGTSSDASGFGVDTSQIDFAASEDLGGGWKIDAAMGFAGADRSAESNGGVMAGRNASLSLTTPVGRLTLASTRAPDYLSGTIAGVGVYYNGFDGKVLSHRSNRDVVSFSAPVGAVTLGVSYQESADLQGLGLGTTGAAGDTGQALTTYGATYGSGPIAANATYLSFASRAGRTKDQTRLSGSYDLGVVKLGLGGVVTNSDAGTGGKATDLLLGVKAPMGAFSLGMNLVNRKIDDVGFTAVKNSAGVATSQGVGTITGSVIEADYALSKRTMVVANYARWTQYVGNDASSQFTLLLSHSF